jgi:hypothetical protein
VFAVEPFEWWIERLANKIFLSSRTFAVVAQPDAEAIVALADAEQRNGEASERGMANTQSPAEAVPAEPILPRSPEPPPEPTAAAPPPAELALSIEDDARDRPMWELLGDPAPTRRRWRR